MSSDCFAEHMIIVIDNTDAYLSQMKQVIDSIRIVDITQLRKYHDFVNIIRVTVVAT